MLVKIKGSNEVVGTVDVKRVEEVGLAYALCSISGVDVDKDRTVSTQERESFFVTLPDGRCISFDDIRVEYSNEEAEKFRCADGVVRIPQ